MLIMKKHIYNTHIIYKSRISMKFIYICKIVIIWLSFYWYTKHSNRYLFNFYNHVYFYNNTVLLLSASIKVASIKMDYINYMTNDLISVFKILNTPRKINLYFSNIFLSFLTCVSDDVIIYTRSFVRKGDPHHLSTHLKGGSMVAKWNSVVYIWAARTIIFIRFKIFVLDWRYVYKL